MRPIESPLIKSVRRQKAWKIEENGVSEETMLFFVADMPCMGLDGSPHVHEDELIWGVFTNEAMQELREVLDAEG